MVAHKVICSLLIVLNVVLFHGQFWCVKLDFSVFIVLQPDWQHLHYLVLVRNSGQKDAKPPQ